MDIVAEIRAARPHAHYACRRLPWSQPFAFTTDLPIDNEAIHLVRATDRKMRKAKEKGVAYQFARLSGRERAAPVEAFVVEVSNTSTMNRAAYHAGEEIFFVLDGVIELELTDRTFRLAKGDYLQSRAA